MPPGERVAGAAACGAFGCTADGPYHRVRHPSKGECVVCAAHARRLAEPVTDGGTKSSGCEKSGSTGETHATLGVVEASGVRKHPEHGAPNTMDASESTPGKGDSAVGASAPSTFWSCRQCGNVVFVEDRPTRCYCCRTGEAEALSEDDRERLYRSVEIGSVEGVKAVAGDGGATTE